VRPLAERTAVCTCASNPQRPRRRALGAFFEAALWSEALPRCCVVVAGKAALCSKTVVDGHAHRWLSALTLARSNWLEAPKDEQLPGRPLRCRRCAGVLILNAASLRSHVASRRHRRATAALTPDAPDPVCFAEDVPADSGAPSLGSAMAPCHALMAPPCCCARQCCLCGSCCASDMCLTTFSRRSRSPRAFAPHSAGAHAACAVASAHSLCLCGLG